MAVMTETPDPPPGERRLERPPSDRYATAGDATGDAAVTDAAVGDAGATPTGSASRGLLFAAVVAVIGALITVLLGGVVSLSAGLLVVAAAVGYAIGLALAYGAGSSIDRPTRPWVAVIVAALGFLLGQAGLWWYASTEGGVLGPMDYLWQTFGVLVPIQALLAVGSAYWGAR
jgi:hypothetical protein